jgi:SAM-dependent methyltransferase
MKREENHKFMDHYRTWRPTRIRKIEKIFGESFFKDKTLLELACGFGDIGKHFRENRGAVVTFAEGRKEHLSFIEENNPGAEVLHLNQEYLWDLKRKFDIIIHFGVMYHLDNWKQDLECALKHTDLIILESEIADSNKVFEAKVIDPISYDQAINGKRIATRPSASYVEKVFEDNGFIFIRYDDADLNDGLHRYDWKVTGDAEKPGYGRNDGGGMRRFWVARRK